MFIKWWRPQCRLIAPSSYNFSSSSVHSSDVYCQLPSRRHSLSFFLTYFFIKTYNLSVCVFICASHPFQFSIRDSLFFPCFCIYFWTLYLYLVGYEMAWSDYWQLLQEQWSEIWEAAVAVVRVVQAVAGIQVLGLITTHLRITQANTILPPSTPPALLHSPAHSDCIHLQ